LQPALPRNYLFNMSDTEERPSKIRRLSRSEDVAENTALANSGAAETENDLMAIDDQLSKELSSSRGAVALAIELDNGPKMSKSALKKLRKSLAWEAGLEDRRLKRREKHKEKQARKRAAKNADPVVDAETGSAVESLEDALKEQKKRTQRPIQVPLTLIMDCDFETYMLEKELLSLSNQLTRCYSENKKNTYRTHFVISSYGGALKTRFETILNNNHLSWKGVTFTEDDFVAAAQKLDTVMKGPEAGKLVGPLAGPAGTTSENVPSEPPNDRFPESGSEADLKPNEEAHIEVVAGGSTQLLEELSTSVGIETIIPQNGDEVTAQDVDPVRHLNGEPKIVYLSADSPYTLERLSPNTSYIVGAIVDKNRHKGLCYKRACERGIPTAKLPIGEYMTMQSRSVLAVNHVVEIMLRWLETGDWGEAFTQVIPKRKEAKLKAKKGGVDQSISGSASGDQDQDEQDEYENTLEDPTEIQKDLTKEKTEPAEPSKELGMASCM